MRIFITGATGYIGGALAARLVAAGHRVTGLTRDPARAEALRARGIEPVIGTLDDTPTITAAAREADAVVNTANSDHRGVADTLIASLSGTGKTLIQSSGTSIVADLADGEREGPVYDESTPVQPLPLRAGRVALNDAVLATANDGVRSVVVAPSLIYGEGAGLHRDSIQVPWLIDVAKREGVGCHVGSGRNVWSNVHIDDLVDLYVAILERAPAGALYYAENGENAMVEVAQAVSRMLGFGGATRALSVPEAVALWGEGGARYTMGSNSRVRAVRARSELGWQPHRPSLLHEIEHGCYMRRIGSDA